MPRTSLLEGNGKRTIGEYIMRLQVVLPGICFTQHPLIITSPSRSFPRISKHQIMCLVLALIVNRPARSANAYIYFLITSLIFMLSTAAHLFRHPPYKGVTPSPGNTVTNTEAQECNDIMVIF